MTLFELVKLALDELYAEGSAMYGSALDAEIKQRMAYLSTCYGSLNNMSRTPIDYKDPATRFAYVVQIYCLSWRLRRSGPSVRTGCSLSFLKRQTVLHRRRSRKRYSRRHQIHSRQWCQS